MYFPDRRVVDGELEIEGLEDTDAAEDVREKGEVIAVDLRKGFDEAGIGAEAVGFGGA